MRTGPRNPRAQVQLKDNYTPDSQNGLQYKVQGMRKGNTEAEFLDEIQTKVRVFLLVIHSHRFTALP